MASAVGAALLSTLIQGAANFAISERTNNRTDAAVARQNEYNLPVNQVERMKAAGLNPAALSMNNGMSISGSTSASPNGYVNPSAPDLLGSASSSLLNLMNSEDLKSTRDARVNKLIAEATQARSNAESLGVGTAGQLILNEYLGAQQEAELSEKRSRIDLNYAQIAQIRTGIKKLQKEIYELLPEQIRNLQSQTAVNELNLPKILAEIADLQASAGLKGAQTELTEAQTNLTESQNFGQIQQNLRYDELTDKILAKYDSEISKLAADTKLTKEQIYWEIFKLESDVLGNSTMFLNERRKLFDRIRDRGAISKRSSYVDSY